MFDMNREVSVYDMLRLVGRAGIATKSGTPVEITNYLRTLRPHELVEEFHRAVVVLGSRGLLSAEERTTLSEYANEWVRSQPLPTEDMWQ